ncbi:MAG: hypothetical protein KGI79_01330 [Patescibacteria group bacterium]|nr:hypothetical protein [Patescibacteria group bacterium]MDE2116500.1 hypothetical protein [Patescibacteria group bacterium]
MNKKGIITLVIIIVLVIIGYAIWGGKGSQNPYAGTTTQPGQTVSSSTAAAFAPVTSGTTDTSLLGRLKSASVAASETGTRVALSNGTAQFSGGGVSGTVTLGSIATETTVNGVGYAFTTIDVKSNGGADYTYVVLFQDSNGSLTDQSYAVLGKGVTVTGLRVDQTTQGLVVTATYNDSTGASKTKIMVVTNGQFDPSKEINL